MKSVKQLSMLSNRASLSLTAIWLAIPLFGKVLAFLSFIILMLARDREGYRLCSLRYLMWVSFTYGGYISTRALIAGEGASEPILDTLVVVLMPAIAFWAIRGPVHIGTQRVFCGVVVFALLVFLAALLERFYYGEARVELFLGNPLNLAPLLLIPSVFMTFDAFAPSRLWILAGLAGVVLSGYLIGGLAQARGLFLGFLCLMLLRAAFSLFEAGHIRERILPAFRIVLAAFCSVFLVTADPAAMTRYSAVTTFEVSHVEETQQMDSMGKRFTMLARGFEAVLERPVFGYGPQNRYSAVFPKDQPNLFQYSHLHNDFLTHAVAGGLIATSLLFLYLLTPAIIAWKTSPDLSRDQAFLRRQFGILSSCALLGTAAMNNVFFVDISAFTTSVSVLWVLVFLESLKMRTRHGQAISQVD